MTADELAKRRDALLHRYLDGEIDKATYDRMLAQLETPSEGPAPDSFGRQQTIWQPPQDASTAPPAPRDDATAGHQDTPVEPEGEPGQLPGEAPAEGSGEAPGTPTERQPATAEHSGGPVALEPGDELGPFRLWKIIGRGGMGEVWKAHDPTADRFVVIKVVPPDVQRAGEEMARVKDAFRRIHALHHQHICPVYLLDEDPRCGYFVVMKYVDGQTLSSYRASYVARHGTFPLDEVVRLLRPVAAALDYAHGQKVVHRDIKPQNVLVAGHDEGVQVIDFGLAAEIHASVSRVSRVRMDASGTYPYMAPEQWRGEYQDARADQYALAVVAYELLAGRLPFSTPDTETLRLAALNDPPPVLEDQPEHVNRALGRALAKRRQERFAHCAAFIEALARPAPPELPEAVVPEVVETPVAVAAVVPPVRAPAPGAARAPAAPGQPYYGRPAGNALVQRNAQRFGVGKRLVLLAFNLACFGAALFAIPTLHHDVFDFNPLNDWPELGEPAAAVLSMMVTWAVAGFVTAVVINMIGIGTVPGFEVGHAMGWFLIIFTAFTMLGCLGGGLEATDWDSLCQYTAFAGLPVMALVAVVMTGLQIATVKSAAAGGATGCGCGCASGGLLLLVLAVAATVALFVDLLDRAEPPVIYEPPVTDDEFFQSNDNYFDFEPIEKK